MNRHYMLGASIAAVSLLASVAPVRAASLDEVNLSPYVNSDLTMWSGGGNYPQHGGAVTIGGVPFELATLPNGHTGVINSAKPPVTIATNIPGATTVYAIINSAWGFALYTTGYVTFYGANPADVYTYTLTEGVNVRDHYCCGGFVETVSAGNLIGTQYYGSPSYYPYPAYPGYDRLDAWQINLPSAFAGDTLKEIVFADYYTSCCNGNPFLGAVTVSAVPLPAALSMIGAAVAGLGGLGWWRRRKAS